MSVASECSFSLLQLVNDHEVLPVEAVGTPSLSGVQSVTCSLSSLIQVESFQGQLCSKSFVLLIPYLDLTVEVSYLATSIIDGQTLLRKH